MYLIVINLVFSFLFLVDLWYYRGFGTMPVLQIIKQTANLNNMSQGILSVMHLIDAVLLLDFPLILVYWIMNRNLCRGFVRNGLLFALTFIIPLGVITYIPLKTDLLEKNWVDPNFINTSYSPIGYHIYSIYSFWKDSKPVQLSKTESDYIRKWFKDKFENLPDNKYKGMFKGKNLIHIDIESMENFVIGRTVNGQEITPNLNRLLKNSLYFASTYEQVNQGNSSDADFMVNTSVYPLRQNSVFYAYPDNTYPGSTPRLLEKLGYNTLALHPDEGTFWNWMPNLTAIGFQQRIGAEAWDMDDTFFLGISDSSFFRQAEPYIARLKQPFYAFMPTQSSHSPFDIPEKYRYMKLDESMANMTLGLYFQSMYYADKCIGEMISYLERDGLLDNTVVVFCGDHSGITRYHPGEAAKVQPAQDWWLVGDKRQIPFIIYQKNISGEKFDINAAQVDILPTIAYIMGVDQKDYEYTAMGRNLLNTKKNFAVLVDGKYVGDASSEEQKEHDIQGLEIADTIVKSNYFKLHE